MRVRRSFVAWVLGLGVVGVSAFHWGRAVASGAPSVGALNYSGVLEDADGNPLAGTHNILLQFWGDDTTTEKLLCTLNSEGLALSAGRFSLALPDTCAPSFQTSPDVWVEVSVDGASLGRVKVGAVPYALEATHATAADNATTFRVSKDLTVQGKLLLGWRVSTSCTWNATSLYTDCSCNAGEVAVSGGGYCADGTLDESRAVLNGSSLPSVWRLGCKNSSGTRVPVSLASGSQASVQCAVLAAR